MYPRPRRSDDDHAHCKVIFLIELVLNIYFAIMLVFGIAFARNSHKGVGKIFAQSCFSESIPSEGFRF